VPVSPEGASIRDALYLLIESSDRADCGERRDGLVTLSPLTQAPDSKRG
jgi:hypothetical protein